MVRHCIVISGEKLDNVERRLDEMNVDLKQTDKNIRELESLCGCCYCPCFKPGSVQVCQGYKGKAWNALITAHG